MISERIGQWVRGHVLGLGRFLGDLGFTPNKLTVIGVILNIIVAVIIATDHPRLGGVLLLFASAFDMLDGAVARSTGQATRFGGFLDSTLDRYSEVFIYFGVLWYLLDTDDAKTGSILVFVSAVGAILISYARARAEAAGYGASVGLVARPERVIALSLGLIFAHPLWALWFLAVATHLTAVTRITHVWRLSLADGESAPKQPAGVTGKIKQS